MKKQALVALIFCLALCPLAAKGGSRGGGSKSGGAHSVKGYTKKDGTYVAPHRQTNPNGTKTDNWSTKGNTNPDTGKAGTKNP